jgi:hypothetical protein
MEVKPGSTEVKNVIDRSIFMDKEVTPTEKELENRLGKAYEIWKEIREIVLSKYPGGQSEWSFPGNKYGWNFRIKDKKRAIIYLLPREKFFLAGFVFGPKAFDAILNSAVSNDIKNSLKAARVYAEGRSVRIQVKNRKKINDITRLIEIKLSF